MEATPGSDDDSAPLSPSGARSLDGDGDLEAGVRPATVPPPPRNRFALIAAAALTAVAIVVIENLNRVHGADDYWTRRYRRRRIISRRASAAARTTATGPRAQTLALRPRVGVVLWGLAGLEERPERNVVLPEGLSIVLAPGPRSLARVDDGRAGLHLLVLSVGETRRVAIHTSNLKHVPRRRRRLPSQMRRPRPRDPLRAHRSRAETGARRSPAYRRGSVGQAFLRRSRCSRARARESRGR